jgi:hypothetical protein
MPEDFFIFVYPSVDLFSDPYNEVNLKRGRYVILLSLFKGQMNQETERLASN